MQRLPGVVVPHRQRGPRGAGGGDGRDGHHRQTQPPGHRLGGIQQRAAADANYHGAVISGFRDQLRDVAFAAVPAKQHFFGADGMKRLRQEGLRTGDGALAVDPDGAGKLLVAVKIVQVGKAAVMGKIVSRAGYHADIAVAHERCPYFVSLT